MEDQPPAANPEFDFGYFALPPGRFQPTSRPRSSRWVRASLAALIILGCAVGVWRLGIHEPDHPKVISDPAKLERDRIEYDPELKPAFDEADWVASQALKELRQHRTPPGQYRYGDARFYWAVKKRLLREKYGIEWRTPAEMNPKMVLE
jgi:hypothetical protein